MTKQVSSLAARLNQHLNVPLYRNGYALVVSTFLTSGIGFLYWVIAARLFPPAVVGLNSAMVSAMMLLGGVAQLNMANAHIRFVPNAGARTRRFVGITYLIGPALGVVITLIFLEFIEEFVPALGFLHASAPLEVFFLVAIMGWCIFSLQDGVLTGLRRATWVPVENAVFSIAKVVIMLVLALSLPQISIFASWVAGLAITILPTSYFIFYRLIPHHIQSHPQESRLPSLPDLGRYVAGDYIGTSAWLACTMLLPIIVTQLAGPTATAHYYLAWQIALLLFTVNSNVGSSLVVEAAHNPRDLRKLSLHMLKQAALLVVPMALAIFAGAPLLLQIFGKGYARDATVLLRLLALSAIPHILVMAYINVARVQRRISRAVAAYLSISVVVLGLSTLFLLRFGLLGVGYAWLVGQTVVALALLPFLLREVVWGVPRPDAELD